MSHAEQFWGSPYLLTGSCVANNRQLQFWDAFDNLLTASNVEAELNFYGSKVVGVFKDSRGGVKEKMIHLGQGLKIEAKTYSKEFIGTFQPTMAGEWRVQVVVNGKEKENPLWPKMQVSPGRLDADGCQVEGLGAAFMQRAGHSYRLAIVPGDKMGNEISPTRPEMGYGCAVDVVYKKDPTNADTIAREIGQKLRFHETDNAYYLQFQPTRSGTLLVEVRILGVEIPQSPLRVRR